MKSTLSIIFFLLLMSYAIKKTYRAIKEIQENTIGKLNYGKDKPHLFFSLDTLKKGFAWIDKWFENGQYEKIMNEQLSKKELDNFSKFNLFAKYLNPSNLSIGIN